MGIRPGDLRQVLAGSSDVSRVKAISDQEGRRQSDQAAAELARRHELARQQVQGRERAETVGIRDDRAGRRESRRQRRGGGAGGGGAPPHGGQRRGPDPAGHRPSVPGGPPDRGPAARRPPEDKRGERLDIVLGA